MSSDSVLAALPAPQSDDPVSTDVGFPLPLGTHVWGGGTNFAVFSRHATRLWLELYDDATDAAPQHRFELLPENHRTGDLWHIWVEGLDPGQFYGYRADGPYAPAEGHRFNPHKLLLDPEATAITHLDGGDYRRAQGFDPESPRQDLSYSTENNAASTPKCIVTERRTGWEQTRPLRRPWSETIIYELHVRGFTIHPSAEVDHPGTFRGLTEKIPYLKDLGITAVDFALPALPNQQCWCRKADTSYPSPDDIRPLREAEPLDQQGHYTMGPRSSAILIASFL